MLKGLHSEMRLKTNCAWGRGKGSLSVFPQILKIQETSLSYLVGKDSSP